MVIIGTDKASNWNSTCFSKSNSRLACSKLEQAVSWNDMEEYIHCHLGILLVPSFLCYF